MPKHETKDENSDDFFILRSFDTFHASRMPEGDLISMKKLLGPKKRSVPRDGHFFN